MLYFASVIDWSNIFFNSLWILGSSIILAAFSYHYWQASERQRAITRELQTTSWRRAFWSGLLLISIGLAGTSQRWWEILLWLILTLLIAYQTQLVWRQQGSE